MGHKIYRICLLSVVIIAIVGGIFYYLNYVQKGTEIHEGTLVKLEESVQAASGAAVMESRSVKTA